jgi:hypothetical protein
MQGRQDDAHTTCGEHFRIPAHSEMVAALGRTTWNFFSLEEGIVALLWEAKASDLNTSRSLAPKTRKSAFVNLEMIWPGATLRRIFSRRSRRRSRSSRDCERSIAMRWLMLTLSLPGTTTTGPIFRASPTSPGMDHGYCSQSKLATSWKSRTRSRVEVANWRRTTSLVGLYVESN